MLHYRLVPPASFFCDPDGEKGKIGGPANASYSADTLTEGRGSIRRPFTYEGKQWISIGGMHQGEQFHITCFPLIPADEYTGIPGIGDATSVLPRHLTSYVGQRVNYRGKPFVLGWENLEIYTPGTLKFPETPLPPEEDDRIIDLEVAEIAESYGYGVIEDHDGSIRAQLATLAMPHTPFRAALRMNRCPILFRINGRLWFTSNEPERSKWNRAGEWNHYDLTEVVAPEDLPPGITPNTFPEGFGYGEEDGRLVSCGGMTYAISVPHLYIGVWKSRHPRRPDQVLQLSPDSSRCPHLVLEVRRLDGEDRDYELEGPPDYPEAICRCTARSQCRYQLEVEASTHGTAPAATACAGYEPAFIDEAHSIIDARPNRSLWWPESPPSNPRPAQPTVKECLAFAAAHLIPAEIRDLDRVDPVRAKTAARKALRERVKASAHPVAPAIRLSGGNLCIWLPKRSAKGNPDIELGVDEFIAQALPKRVIQTRLI